VKVPMTLAFLGVILLSLLNWHLIPLYQLPGASLAVCVTSVVLAILVLLYTKLEFAISLLPRAFFLSLFSTLFFTLLAFSIPTNQYAFIPIGAMLFVLHLGFLFSTGVIKKEDFFKSKKVSL
jgi:O-antigen/teichoic acid export membrane protein